MSSELRHCAPSHPQLPVQGPPPTHPTHPAAQTSASSRHPAPHVSGPLARGRVGPPHYLLGSQQLPSPTRKYHRQLLCVGAPIEACAPSLSPAASCRRAGECLCQSPVTEGPHGSQLLRFGETCIPPVGLTYLPPWFLCNRSFQHWMGRVPFPLGYPEGGG